MNSSEESQPLLSLAAGSGQQAGLGLSLMLASTAHIIKRIGYHNEMRRFRLQNLSIILLLEIALLALSCKKSTPVEDDREVIPSEKPQVNILWPSLADSPWPMYLHDPQHTGRASVKGPELDSVQRLFATGNSVYSSPAIGADGNIIFGSDDGYVYSVKPDGSLNWKYLTQGSGEIATGPVIGLDGNVYVCKTGGTYALNADGSLRWYVDGVESRAPALSKDGAALYVTKPGITALSAFDGSILWEVQAQVFNPCAIVPDGGIIIAGTADGYLTAIDTGGAIVWKSDHLGGPVSAPSVDNASNIYAIAGGFCWALDSSGALRWKSPITSNSGFNSPTIGWNGTIYVVGDVTLYAFDYSGQLKWSHDLKTVDGQMKWSDNTAVVDVEETLYLGTLTHREFPDTVNFMIFSGDGSIHSQLTLKSPEKPYVPLNHLYPDIDSTPAIGSGVLYVGSDRPQGVHLFVIR